jgi:hypothetical protein
MYRDGGIKYGYFIIEELLKNQTDNYLIIDWQAIKYNLSQPIFAKPFPPSFMVDVLTGKVKVFIGIDGDALIRTLNESGLNSRWYTEKETARHKQKSKRIGFVEINRKAIAITIPGIGEHVLFGGIFSKIIFDNIYPSNIALTILSRKSPEE